MKATGEIRTPDRLITNQVLYQLSHSGMNFGNHARRIISLIQKNPLDPLSGVYVRHPLDPLIYISFYE